MAGSIGSLNAKLGLDASGLLTGLQKAEGRLASFGAGFGKLGSLASTGLAGLGAGVSFGAFAAAIKSTIDDAGRLVDVSSKLDIGVGALEQLELAAKTSGVEATTLHGAIGKLQQKIGEAARGEEAAVKDFEAMGFAWRELAVASPDEAFSQVALKIGGMTTAYERADAATQVFGKSGKELIPLLRDFQGEMDLAGKALVKLSDEGAQKLDAMGDAWERLKAKAKSSFREILVGTAEFLENGPGGKPQKPLAEQWFEAFDKNDLEKQFTLAKRFADIEHARKIAIARGATEGELGISGVPSLSEGNTWDRQVAGIAEALDKVKEAKADALEMAGWTKQMEELEASWQKWADKAAQDAREPFEVMNEQIENLKHAFAQGFLNKSQFERALAKADGSADRQRAFEQKAMEVGNSLLTPSEKMTADFEQFERMEEQGLLNMNQLGQLKGKGLLDMERGMGGLTNRGDVGAMAKGSAEAASVINRALNDAGRERDPQARVAAILERQEKLEQEQRDFQERMADALDALGVG